MFMYNMYIDMGMYMQHNHEKYVRENRKAIQPRRKIIVFINKSLTLLQ